MTYEIKRSGFLQSSKKSFFLSGLHRPQRGIISLSDSSLAGAWSAMLSISRAAKHIVLNPFNLPVLSGLKPEILCFQKSQEHWK